MSSSRHDQSSARKMKTRRTNQSIKIQDKSTDQSKRPSITLKLWKTIEDKRWQSDIQNAGLPSDLTHGQAARAALFCPDFPEVSPEEAARREHLHADEENGTEEDGDEIDDLDDMSDTWYSSSDEDSAEDSDEFVIYDRLGLLGNGKTSPTDNENRISSDEEISKVFCSGLSDLNKASKFNHRGYEKISYCLGKRPGLSTLNHLLEDFLPSKAPSQHNFPQTWVPTENVSALAGFHRSGVKKTPIKITKNGFPRFVCPFCDKEGASWSGLDSHIRLEHTKIHYGPCTVCKVFTTSNQGSYRKHHKRCLANQSEGKGKPRTNNS